MGRVLMDLDPAHAVSRAAKEGRAAGIRTAVLPNSLGHSPHDPYALRDLTGILDVLVYSAITASANRTGDLPIDTPSDRPPRPSQRSPGRGPAARGPRWRARTSLVEA